MKSPSQRQREYRQRIKEQQRVLVGAPDETLTLGSKGFEQFVEQHDDWNAADANFDVIGMEIAPIAGTYPQVPEGWPDIQFGSAIEKAQYMVETWRENARLLARAINEFKRQRVAEEIDQLEASDLSDQQVRKEALQRIVQLRKLDELLRKETRWIFPATGVKGGRPI